MNNLIECSSEENNLSNQGTNIIKEEDLIDGMIIENEEKDEIVEKKVEKNEKKIEKNEKVEKKVEKNDKKDENLKNIEKTSQILNNNISNILISDQIPNGNILISDTKNNSEINLFNFKNRKLFKGQWVDVKDTIEQWLEAQVIDVKENKVYVHYNGWGTRWDEWIDLESDRIRPFRFHTRQTNYSHYQSPFPVIKPDANVSLEGNLPLHESFFEIFEDIDKQYKHAKELMDKIKSARVDLNSNSQKEVFALSKNLAPFFDRLGRTISDVGGYMNTSMRSNKLEDLDKKLFDSQILDSELKPLNAAEITQVEAEENARRSSRESGMNVITPVNKFERSMTNQVCRF
jgi:hypothetical protein